MRARVKLLIICGILSVYIDNVNGDVFELCKHDKILGKINITVNHTDEFRNFVVLNKHALPRESINPFTENAISATQMLGYAVFFPKSDTLPQPVYVAKKRPYSDAVTTPITDYNNVASANLFKNATNFDHSERQLISYILKNNEIKPEAEGIICIYTYAPPCRVEGEDNQHICCVDYYKKLALLFKNIQFNIYFKDATVSNIFNKDFNGDSHFFRSVADIINSSLTINLSVKYDNNQFMSKNKINFTKAQLNRSKRFVKDKIETAIKGKEQESFNDLYNPQAIENLKFYIVN